MSDKKKCKHFEECTQLVYYGEYTHRCVNGYPFIQEQCWENWRIWERSNVKTIPKEWKEKEKD
jgi:hypothetical protein